MDTDGVHVLQKKQKQNKKKAFPLASATARRLNTIKKLKCIPYYVGAILGQVYNRDQSSFPVAPRYCHLVCL